MKPLARAWQLGLLALALVAAIVLAGAIALTLAAGNRDGPPAHTYHLNAGPYALDVNLYRQQAQAGLALPFSIAPVGATSTALSYEVNSLPGYGVSATQVRASISPDPNTPGGVVGSAEIPVRGPWTLLVKVDGPQGSGSARVPVEAIAPPSVPDWLGWLIGFVPAVGLLLFLLLLTGRRRDEETQPA